MIDRLVWGGLASAMLLTALVSADVHADVGPAPSCPTGQTSSYFRGRYCSPTPCSAGAACGAGAVCAERGLCVLARAADDPSVPPQALGDCATDADCLGGARCVHDSFCGPAPAGTPAPAPEPPPAAAPVPASDARAEDCSLAHGRAPGLSLAAFLLAAGLLSRRRARR